MRKQIKHRNIVPRLSREDLKLLSSMVDEDYHNGSFVKKKDANVASYLRKKLLDRAYIINSKHINNFEWRWLKDNGYVYEAGL